jgi:hypothetical protein
MLLLSDPRLSEQKQASLKNEQRLKKKVSEGHPNRDGAN